MIDELAGKSALVTGAGVRVGRAIALALGAAGMRVALHYHQSKAAAERTRGELEARGGQSLLLQADLSDRDAARSLVDRAVSGFGGLDLLVASAAGFDRVAYDDIDDAGWDRMLALNLTSPFVLAQRATAALRASRGSVVFITCSSATTPFRNHLPYVVAKGGLSQLTRTLALELAPEVRVNAVAPGTVLPPEDMSPAVVERLRSRIPLQAIGGAEDVARAVVFLASSPFVTGEEIVVDGGRSVAAVERFE